MKAAKPKRYIVQTHVEASSAAEALEKAAKLPATSVFLDTTNTEKSPSDAIGFKTVPEPE